jgi:imidazolonepropionase-like amidohydrolase
MRSVKISGSATSFLVALLLGLFAVGQQSRAQEPQALIVEGGTLIDGNGGAPVRDSVILIQGNQIVRVGVKGQGSYPPNARIINASGKYVLPGLIEGQSSYNWYFGEAMLNYGVTSTIDVATAGGIAVPHRDSVLLGKVMAPRSFTGIAMIASSNAGGRWANWTGFESPLSPDRVPKSAEETREMVRFLIASGADYINFQDGSLPLDFYRAGIDEARKAGKPVFTRAFGAPLNPREAAMMGARNLPHSAGIGAAVSKKVPAEYKFAEAGPTPIELDFYAEMDDAKAKELIQVLVANKTRLTPTFQVCYPGYPKDWARFGAEVRALFNDPNLRAYYPEDAVAGVLAGFAQVERGPVRERRMVGYQNALRFNKMFSDAGGMLVVGANTNSNKAPGLSMHHELQSLAESGIAPMKLIQGGTKWAAEMIDKGDQLGTIEAGKLADLFVVNADPLENIANLEKVDTVIFNGKVVDRGYHSWYSVPFPVEGNGLTAPVDGLGWVAALKKATFAPPGGGGEGGARPAAVALPDAVLSPQPAIETISPEMVTEGSSTLTVTLKGFNFVRKTVVYFNGVSVPYKPVSPTELQLMLDADLLRTPGRFSIVVKNPGPFNRVTDVSNWGNGISNHAYLLVRYRN